MRVLSDVTDYTAGSMRCRAFLGIAADGTAAVAFPSVVRASSGDAQVPALLLAKSAGPAPADWTALARGLAGTRWSAPPARSESSRTSARAAPLVRPVTWRCGPLRQDRLSAVGHRAEPIGAVAHSAMGE